jgi:hypothetical protein
LEATETMTLASGTKLGPYEILSPSALAVWVSRHNESHDQNDLTAEVSHILP